MKFNNCFKAILISLLICLITAKTLVSNKLKTDKADPKAKRQQDVAAIEVKNYEQLWSQLFQGGAKRPGNMCMTPLNIVFRPVIQPLPPAPNENYLPKPKPNVFYNKFGFEDSAYFWDFMDNILQQKIVAKFKEIWEKAKTAPKDPKVKDVYSSKEMVIFYYNTGGKPRILYDPFKEADVMKLTKTLTTFNSSIDPALRIAGITMNQLPALVKQFGIHYNPGLIGWQKKMLDAYDFNGDGTLSAEEFFFLLIWESRTKLADDRLFKEICVTVLDPIFDYLDCDSDGYINAEGIWVGMRELIRPTPECDIYRCLSPKTRLPLRTTAPNDVVLKNNEEAQGILNKNEWRKAAILAYWDRQINNNNIFPDDKNNQKDLRWYNKSQDMLCSGGSTPR